MNTQAASRPDETEPHGPSLPPRVVASRPRRLLLAEDDPSLRQMLVSAFLADGFEVVAAADGLELLANIERALEVRREKADAFLVVADVHMPGLTGLDVLAILRCAGRQTPVILITAFGDSDTCAEALELGAAAVLDKPFDLDQLLSEARRALPTR
jgi:DNA-binding response OmpR family regulator